MSHNNPSLNRAETPSVSVENAEKSRFNVFTSRRACLLRMATQRSQIAFLCAISITTEAVEQPQAPSRNALRRKV